MLGGANQWSGSGQPKYCPRWWILILNMINVICAHVLQSTGKCLPPLYVAVHCSSFILSSIRAQSWPLGKVNVPVASHTCDRTVQSSLWSIRYLVTATEMPSSGPLQPDPVIKCATEWLTLDITTQLSSCTQTVIYCCIIGPLGLRMMFNNDWQNRMSHSNGWNPCFIFQREATLTGYSVFLHPSRQMLVVYLVLGHYRFLPHHLQFLIH
jgi:hypothetical protein